MIPKPHADRIAVAVTYGGARFDLLHPRPEAVDFGVIAEHLSKIARFSGATYTPYSVAQHSIVVADALPPELRIYGLLHDAPEAFTGDIPAPFQSALAGFPAAANGLAVLHDNIAAAIWRAAGVPPPSRAIATQVLRADLMARKSEARDLIPGADPEDFGPGPMLRRTIKPLSWDHAHAEFLRALELVGLNPRRLAA